jgi:hypothetical protein
VASGLASLFGRALLGLRGGGGGGGAAADAAAASHVPLEQRSVATGRSNPDVPDSRGAAFVHFMLEETAEHADDVVVSALPQAVPSASEAAPP